LRKILVISGIAAAGALGAWLTHKYVPTSDSGPMGRAKDWVVDRGAGLKDRMLRASSRPEPQAYQAGHVV
jgi:hypothetical protein